LSEETVFEDTSPAIPTHGWDRGSDRQRKSGDSAL